VSTRKLPRASPLRRPFISPYNLPEPYRSWLIEALPAHAQGWSPSALLTSFDGLDDSRPPASHRPDERWASSIEDYLDLVGSLIHDLSGSNGQDAVASLVSAFKESEADRTARLEQVQSLTASLEELERDRAARLEQVQSLTASLEELERDRAARLEQVQSLTASLEELERDRAARLDQIHSLARSLSESERDRVERLEQIQALTALCQSQNERYAQEVRSLSQQLQRINDNPAIGLGNFFLGGWKRWFNRTLRVP
jgi:hypothetical protein